MTHRLATNYAKNYCNRTLIVKVIVQNVVACFLGGHGVDAESLGVMDGVGTLGTATFALVEFLACALLVQDGKVAVHGNRRLAAL